MRRGGLARHSRRPGNLRSRSGRRRGSCRSRLSRRRGGCSNVRGQYIGRWDLCSGRLDRSLGGTRLVRRCFRPRNRRNRNGRGHRGGSNGLCRDHRSCDNRGRRRIRRRRLRRRRRGRNLGAARRVLVCRCGSGRAGLCQGHLGWRHNIRGGVRNENSRRSPLILGWGWCRRPVGLRSRLRNRRCRALWLGRRLDRRPVPLGRAHYLRFWIPLGQEVETEYQSGCDQQQQEDDLPCWRTFGLFWSGFRALFAIFRGRHSNASEGGRGGSWGGCYTPRGPSDAQKSKQSGSFFPELPG